MFSEPMLINSPGQKKQGSFSPQNEERPTKSAIAAEGLSKCYRIYDQPRDRLLQAIWGRDWRGKAKCFYREFWALREVSFSLNKGQTLGVVGRNGSGKSTLLQLLCGTLQPTSGSIETKGRVAALLELGSGFNPEFSGIENIFLNASILGLRRSEIEAKLDQILAFADIGEFISQPVKTYSSGMAVRLAFAVQAHVNPDILVVDEALAVGDELFQKKCYAHLERLKEQGTAVLLVTHSCQQIIQHCDQALLLHKGRARMLSEPSKVTVTYQRLINASDTEWDALLPIKTGGLGESEPSGSTANATETEDQSGQPDNDIRSWFDPGLVPQSMEVYPSHGGRIDDAWIESTSGERVNVLPFGEDFILTFVYKSDIDLERVSFSCHLASHTGQRVSGQTWPQAIGVQTGRHVATIHAGHTWKIRYRFFGGLWPGVYFIGGGIIQSAPEGRAFIHRVVDIRALRILENEPLSVVGSCALRLAPPEVEGLEQPPA